MVALVPPSLPFDYRLMKWMDFILVFIVLPPLSGSIRFIGFSIRNLQGKEIQPQPGDVFISKP